MYLVGRAIPVIFVPPAVREYDPASVPPAIFVLVWQGMPSFSARAGRAHIRYLFELPYATLAPLRVEKSTSDGSVVEYLLDPKKIGANTLFATHYH